MLIASICYQHFPFRIWLCIKPMPLFYFNNMFFFIQTLTLLLCGKLGRYNINTAGQHWFNCCSLSWQQRSPKELIEEKMLSFSPPMRIFDDTLKIFTRIWGILLGFTAHLIFVEFHLYSLRELFFFSWLCNKLFDKWSKCVVASSDRQLASSSRS